MGLYSCTCDRIPPLCDSCVDDLVSHLGGMAQARGCRWAEAIARVIPLDRPWPPTTDRMRAMARKKISDVADDERVIELFTELVIAGASHWWDEVLRTGLWRAG